MEKTMVQLNKKTTERLKMLKTYGRQSYDEVINALIEETEEGPLTEQEIKEIEQGLADVKAGRVKSIEEVAKGYGIKLK